jgi:DNA polymerase III epsilon subunit-like protein
VADHFSIPIFDRHRAGSDALATAEVFLHLLSRLKENGVEDLAAARRFQSQLPKETPREEQAALLPLVSGL